MINYTCIYECYFFSNVFFAGGQNHFGWEVYENDDEFENFSGSRYSSSKNGNSDGDVVMGGTGNMTGEDSNSSSQTILLSIPDLRKQPGIVLVNLHNPRDVKFQYLEFV